MNLQQGLGLGDQQFSSGLAGGTPLGAANGGGGIDMNISGGMVNAPAFSGCTINGPLNMFMPHQESDQQISWSPISDITINPLNSSLDGRSLHGRVCTVKKMKTTLQRHLKDKFSMLYDEYGNSRVQDIYTDLYIVDGRTGGVNSSHEVSSLNMREIGRVPRSEDKQIKLDKMFTDPLATKVLTLGIAGVGKTVAVQKFVMDWAEEKTNQDIDFVFVLLFRELNNKRKQNYRFVDLLHAFYTEFKGLKHLTEDGKILFVLDGLDESKLKLDFQKCISEINEESTVDILIASLINGKLLPSALVWVTTRPAAANLIPQECFNLVVEIRGFNDPQKIEFFQRSFKNPEKSKRVITHVTNNRSLHIMCYIPVFCRILAFVLDEFLEDSNKREPPKTLTEIYTFYSVFQIIRMDKKYSKNMSPKKKQQFLIKLGKLAFNHLRKGTLIFYTKDLKKFKLNVKSGPLESGICTQIFKKESAITGENIFSFVHLSVQEFLAALYVLHKGVHAANPFLKTTKQKIGWLFTHTRFDLYTFAVEKGLESQNGHLDLFVRFLLGLAPMLEPKICYPLNMVLPKFTRREVSINKTIQFIKGKIREDISPERIINLFHCLNELGDNSLVEEINRYINSADEVMILTPAQCSALAYLLLMSAENFEEFDLKKYLRSDEGLKRMLPVAKVSKRVWLNQCYLSKASCKIMTSVLQSTSSHLRELDMSDNDLQDEGVELLSAGLGDPHCKVETLRLNQCQLSKRSCEMMASVLQRTPSHLRELDMSNNDLQDKGVELLSVGLRDPQCKLEKLRLHKCHLSKGSCKTIASVLQRATSHLKELDASKNDIQDEGAELLCAGLRNPQCKLETLRINWCSLSINSCKIMALVLQKSSHLRDLDMSENDLWDKGVELLCHGLQDPQCNLETLRLSACLITHKGCNFLVSALQTNPSCLKLLDLSYNNPGVSGVQKIMGRRNDPNCKLQTFRYDCGGECRIQPGLRKYTCDITLDPKTAHRRLHLSQRKRTVTREIEEHLYPDHPERFDSWEQVLCKEGLSERCYWEVEYSGDGAEIAVAYKGIERKGEIYSRFECNNKCWSLNCCGNRCSACHNNQWTDIPVPSSHSSRVGVYLDWPAGTLSFYSVSSDTLTHLHTFHTTFTEPLYPGFRCYSSLSLC